LAIQPGSPITIIAGTDPLPDRWSTADSLGSARRFQREVLVALGNGDHDAVTRQLALAASQFRVIRVLQPPPHPREGGKYVEQRTIIAGYPWFADWGRDTM